MENHRFYSLQFSTLIRYLLTLGLAVLLVVSHITSANTIDLPSFGVSSRTISEEKRIGSAWLKQYRRQVPTTADPIITYYSEQLLQTLATNSKTHFEKLSLVIAKNNQLNAFAVPGGIVGLHTGLFQYAKTEEQFASVLAHELAHLSQRHYARGVEKQQGQALTTAAALLAGLILAANSDGNAGIATISAAQALTIDQQLRFSRSFEREADRIGMEILVSAGFNPHATENMFKELERINRFGSNPPEFLLTHPLTNSRIIDAINFAREYPKSTFEENINYQLVRARASLSTELFPQQAINRFKNEISGFDTSIDGSRYGLALAYIDAGQLLDAQEMMDILIKKYPENLILKITYSDILLGLNNNEQAFTTIQQALTKNPNYYPLKYQLSQLHIIQKNYQTASRLLSEITQAHPNDPYGWFQLAEISGLNNDINLLNKARAEYFILHGDFDNAEQQLKALLKREEKKSDRSDFYIYAKERIQSLKQERILAKL